MAEFDELVQTLRDPDTSFIQRVDAVRDLGTLESPDVVVPLVEAIDDGERMVREEAVKALGKLGAREAVPALVQVLEGREESMQRYAAEALGQIGGSEAKEALTKAAESDSWMVKNAAKDALKDLREDEEKAEQMTLPPADKQAPGKSSGTPSPAAAGPAGDVLERTLKGSAFEWEKDPDGLRYVVRVPLPDGRGQKVYITKGGADSDGAPLLNMYTACGPATPQNYEWALRRNMKLSFGAFAIADHGKERLFVMVDTHLEDSTEPEVLMKSIMTLARHGDRLEQTLTKKDRR